MFLPEGSLPQDVCRYILYFLFSFSVVKQILFERSCISILESLF